MWFYQKTTSSNKQTSEGPETLESLQKMVDSRQIVNSVLVRKQGESEWRPLAKVNEYNDFLRNTRTDFEKFMPQPQTQPQPQPPKQEASASETDSEDDLESANLPSKLSADARQILTRKQPETDVF